MKFIIMVWLAFFARHSPVSTARESGLHEHDQVAGDQRPHEVDGDSVLADRVDEVGQRQAPFLESLTDDVVDGAGKRAARIALGQVVGLGTGDSPSGRRQ